MPDLTNFAVDAKPVWLDRAAYPFPSRWLDLPAGRMHYVDEGEGEVLLFVHGNPSWSYEYRRLIEHFSATHRCIAVDHLGFGLSAKPAGASYLPQWHAENLRRFVHALDLRDVIIVVQDWGGPIALDLAVDEPDRVRAIVASNSWFFDVRGYTILRRFSRIIGSRLGRSLCRRFNFFPRVLLKGSFGDASRLTPAIHGQYLAPGATPDERKGTWVFPKAIVGESTWLDSIWSRRSSLIQKPALLIWGMKDQAFAPLLPRWQEAFPLHQVMTFADVGHNVARRGGRAIHRAAIQVHCEDGTLTVVAVLGASGRLGSHVVSRLASRNCSIRALIHRNDVASRSLDFTVVRGDVHDCESLAGLLKGVDVVVSTLGNAGAPTPDVCSTAVANLIPLMHTNGIDRIVSTTGSAARLDTEEGNEHRWLLMRRSMLMRHMPDMILDAETHMRLLAATSLSWTVVRAPILTVGRAELPTLSAEPAAPDTTLAYDAVATLLVEELLNPQWIGAAPFAIPG